MAVHDEVFFIVGCPRSGSTLLNRLLRDCLDIGLANELQLIPKYYQRLKHYGDLSVDGNLEKLLGDVMKEPYVSIFERVYTKHLGRPVRLKREAVKTRIPEPTLAGVIYGLLKETAVQLEKSRVGNKHLAMGFHMDWLNELFPRCKVIHLVRDGRDCALSLFRQQWGQKNAYSAARFWVDSVSMPRRYGRSRMGDRYLEVRYEDLMSQPHAEMMRIRNFVEGKDMDATLPLPCKDDLASIKSGNTYKWKTKMRLKDVTIFQGTAGEVLEESGYQVTEDRSRPLPWMCLYYIVEDRGKRQFAHRFPDVKFFATNKRWNIFRKE